MKLLVYGSANYDSVIRVEHIVKPGETICAERQEVFIGGKGLNQAAAIAGAGAEVYLAAVIGEDGKQLLDTAVRAGVRTEYISTVKGPSGRTFLQVGDDGENAIVVFPGANAMNSKRKIQEVLSAFGPDDFILLQNEINLLPELIDAAYERGIRVVLNPSPMNDVIRKCRLDRVSVFVLNRKEAVDLTGKEETEPILEEMKTRFPDAMTVLTLGKDGSVCMAGNRIFRQKSFPVRAVDTTGAGDTFTGYFLAALSRSRDIRDALRIASAAAAISVTRMGALASIPSRNEVEDFLHRNASEE